MTQTYTDRISSVTFSVHHNPNCNKPFQVRLVGRGAGRLDNIQGEGTQDICGYGDTLEEAARVAWTIKHDGAPPIAADAEDCQNRSREEATR